MANNIVQWNCRGLKANYNEILLLMSKYNPALLCLSETFLKGTDKVSFKNFSMYNFIHNTERASGGSTIIVSNVYPHRQISINSNLQAVALSVTLHRPISVCSLYIPPKSKINVEDLENLINQLPQPFFLLGDFNGHHELWGCSDSNTRGQLIEMFLERNSLCLLNDKSNTYLHPATGKFSSLDLSICQPNIFLDFEWKVLDDLHGSDHFPILISDTSSIPEDHPSYYKFNKGNWEQYHVLCKKDLTLESFSDFMFDPVDRFSILLTDIADKSIPKTSGNKKAKDKPWFDDDCKTAVRKRRAAVKKFNNRPTKENLESVRIMRAKARRTIKQSKKRSWKSYVSKLNSRSSVKKVWDMVRKISGKRKKSNISHLIKSDESVITTKEGIANVLGETFSKNSSSENYDKKFQHVKSREEKKPLNFKSNNTEDYNKPFSPSELLDSLEKCHDTAVGPDHVHYQLLKHLPQESLDLLLEIYNRTWTTGAFPDSWREATIIPVPKPGKDSTNPGNYRPIALTSCICKTFERMINSRLVWYLESQGLITNIQSGFRKQRSTTDHLVRLENFIRDAFIKKEHIVSIFFDLEKAYDTTWKHGIMRDLEDLGLKGRLPNFISNFLEDRNFKVRVGSTLSDSFEQEQGVPQGSILSVSLFSIKINNIVKCLLPGTDCSLYVDDFLICYRSKNMRTIERQLQQCLDRLQNWTTENGFKFSKSKTQCVHFCQLRKLHCDPELFLDGTKIPVVTEAKFLGVIFDRKLSFIPHLKYLKAKCLKALNLLKVISNTDWGADRQVLLRLYRTLIRSKLDYGCVIYGSARKSYLQMLDTIHHQGLRIALGAFRTSPVESLYVEANEPSLYARREKLSLQYAVKVAANKSNPARNIIFKPKYTDSYEQKPKQIKPLGLRLNSSMSEIDFHLDNVKENSVPQTPPWTLNTPTILFDMLSASKKSETNPEIFKSKYNEIRTTYNNHFPIYTDGSKDDKKVGCAVVSQLHQSKLRLPNNASIFSAEAKAIDLALNFISNYNERKFIIFTDSLSILQSINNRNMENPFIQNILLRFHELSFTKSILFCWIPSHMGIRGNEDADRAAKKSLALPQSNIKLPYTDFNPCINKYIFSKWQLSWNNAVFNKLHDIEPTLGDWHQGNRSVRREEVVLSRCRIGHSHLTHSYLLKGEDQPECVPCQAPLSIKHILIDCVDFAPQRNRYFHVSSMSELFKKITVDKILTFLKDIGIYYKL